MKSADSNTIAALQAAPESGYAVRDLVYFNVRTLDGEDTEQFGFWNDIDIVTIQVLRGDSGSPENRNYVGDGSLLGMSPITLSSDLTIQTATITLSQIHATVQNMVRGYDCRQAGVEIHRVLFDPRTHAVISAAQCHFVGKVNQVTIGTPKAGDEGGIELNCVSHIREMTRVNSAKKSDETQRRRSGDRFRRNAGVANVKLFWGQDKGRAAVAASKPASNSPVSNSHASTTTNTPKHSGGGR